MTSDVGSAAATAGGSGARTPSAIDALANRYVETMCQLDPLLATTIGVDGHDDRLTDLSPEGVDARAAASRALLAELATLEPVDAVDEVTVAAMRERLGLELEIHDAGLDYGPLDVIDSPAQGLRDAFDLMPSETADHWATIARRMSAMPEATRGYLEGLRHAIATGDRPARRQVEAVVAQCRRHADRSNGYFARLTDQARPDGAEAAPALAKDLAEGAQAAAVAYEELARTLGTEVLAVAREEDACGREVYALWSRYHVGAEIDLEETYHWGQEELARIEAEMAAVSDRIVPGGSVDDAVAHLEADPSKRIRGTEAFRDWMQQRSDQAVADLADTHFDIPAQVRTLECRIAPTNTGGIYYTAPSEDFSRPGRMWWSVPDGVSAFDTWRETTTVFHEGVPGHHLQVAQTLVRSELLNRWRRLMCWTSGHGEGWALYAERLMADLGYLDDPADRLGMLDGSALRAMRVVGDIGLHCGFEAPADVGGGSWDADKLWQFMTTHTRQDRDFLVFEHLRYLGWPGQAPAYKVGERLWLQIRDEVREREAGAFDLKTFHRRALDIGSVGLDVLKDALVR